jgi:ribonuclease P protein component
MPTFTLKKEERLKSRKVIKNLFQRGQSFAAYPLRLVWMQTEEAAGDFPVRFALTVAKKKFPRAVQRNRIRRQMREAWRLNKHLLYEKLPASEQKLAFMVIYSAPEGLPSRQIHKGMRKMIRRFLQQYTANPKPENKVL